jgi:hypothetical protein
MVLMSLPSKIHAFQRTTPYGMSLGFHPIPYFSIPKSDASMCKRAGPSLSIVIPKSEMKLLYLSLPSQVACVASRDE